MIDIEMMGHLDIGCGFPLAISVVGRVQLSEILYFPDTKCQSEINELDRILLMQCIT